MRGINLQRWRAVRRAMAEQDIEALLVTHLPDVRWLCGFTGSNAALALTGTKAALFTDGRYTTQAREERAGRGWRSQKVGAAGMRCAAGRVSETGVVRSGAHDGGGTNADALRTEHEEEPGIFCRAEEAAGFGAAHGKGRGQLA